jgi:bifunctional UDP-N-acetylglucosamine pyrophosphorylase / glucosamine-1-phosphate N-acetyltransferase
VRLLPLVQKNARKKEYYLTDLVEIFFNKGQKIATVSVQDETEGFGVNHRSDLARAATIMRQRILERLMMQGVTIVDPLTTFIDAYVRIGRDTVIKPCVVIEKDVVIGEGCTIGPFCHLRPKTRIKKNVQIGNFAEVSRSELGENSLMKHFGFLGDARLGRSVNVGAGVVTANYNGKNKSISRVGDASFLGSDSILVAPVSLGKSVTTGAGCVITKGKKIPSGAVVVGVPGKIRMKGKNNG